MVKHESRNVERTNGDRDMRSAEQPRCVELSAFELELIAGGCVTHTNTGGISDQELTSTKR